MTVMKLISGIIEPVEVSDQIAALLEIKPAEKQKILEEVMSGRDWELSWNILPRKLTPWNLKGQFTQKPKRDLKTK